MVIIKTTRNNQTYSFDAKTSLNITTKQLIFVELAYAINWGSFDVKVTCNSKPKQHAKLHQNSVQTAPKQHANGTKTACRTVPKTARNITLRQATNSTFTAHKTAL